MIAFNKYIPRSKGNVKKLTILDVRRLVFAHKTIKGFITVYARVTDIYEHHIVTRGRPKPSQVIAYWPALLHRSRVTAKVLCIATDGEEEFSEINFPVRVQARPERKSSAAKLPRPHRKWHGKSRQVRLQDICYARSGDKGDTCNIGVLARTPAVYDWILENLTAAKVKKFFADVVHGRVIRYELDNLQGLNFLLEESLGGGGTTSLLIDPQGKTLAQALLQMPVRVPVSLLHSS